MKRLPAMQDWPLLLIRARTAVAAAAETSADGMTMKGSDPPSSSTDFFTWSAAMEATERPAGSEPVRVTALTLASARTPATSEPPISRVRKEPSGNPARSKSVSRKSAAWGTFEACLSRPELPAISAGAAKRMTCQSG